MTDNLKCTRCGMPILLAPGTSPAPFNSLCSACRNAAFAPTPPRSFRWGRLLTLLVIALLLILPGYLFPWHPTNFQLMISAPLLLGASFVGGLLATLLCFLILTRKWGIWINLASIFLFGFSLLFGGAIYWGQEVYQNRMVQAAIRNDFAIMARLTAGQQTTQETVRQLEITPKLSGPYAPTEKFLRNYFHDCIVVRRDYEQAINDSKLTQLLVADRLAQDSNLSESRACLRSVKSACDRYHDNFNTVIDTLKNATQNLDINPEFKAGMAQGIITTLPTARAYFENIIKQEYAILDEFQAIIDLLDQPGHKWKCINHTIIFAQPKDRDSFQQHLQNIQKISAAEQLLQAQQSQSSLQTINNTINSIK